MMNHQIHSSGILISIREILDEDQWMEVSNFSNASQVVTGSGLTTRVWRRMQVNTGTTIGSTAIARTVAGTSFSRGKATDIMDWSKQVIIYLTFTNKNNTTNGVTRFTLGKNTSEGVGALSDKGIGIQVDNLALKGLVHDGTDGAIVDLSTTLVDNQGS